ncbi:phage tail fiber protein [Streptomyces lasiicapitis]|uniref:phage tail fiber protein n=1 Tax=Streptomyces lasiicapitis TaxID=1923961 RepID=UPI003650F959
MSVGFSTAAANTHLDNQGSAYSWIKLHVGDPGAAGTANAAAETTRKQATWGSASGAAKTTSADLVWTNVAGTEDYTHFSMWTASTAGSFGGSGTVTANAVVSADTFTIPAGELDLTLPVAA